MADIKIKRTNTAGDYAAETTVEITGAVYINEELIKSILDKTGQPDAPLIVNAQAGSKVEVSNRDDTEREEKETATDAQLCHFRMVVSADICPDDPSPERKLRGERRKEDEHRKPIDFLFGE